MNLNSQLSKVAQRFLIAGALLLVGAFAWAQPVPTGSLDDGEGFLGSPVTLEASFSNSSALETDVGYGPYLDVMLPGAPQLSGFQGASYLGQDLDFERLTLDSSGNATHPFALHADGTPVTVSGPPGGELVVLTLPFGSVARDQPDIDIAIRVGISEHADPGVMIPVSVTPGFRYGSDPLDNPSDDPQIREAGTTAEITPRLVRFHKRLMVPEGDTPVGESFTHQYQIVMEIAGGQTLSSVVITDDLPTALVIRGATLSVTVDGTSAGHIASFEVVEEGDRPGALPVVFPASNTGPFAASNFTIELADPVSTTAGATSTVVVGYDFYIPAIDANGDPAGWGTAANQDENNAAYSAQWHGNNSVPAGELLDGHSVASVNIRNTSNQHPAYANGTIRLQKWIGARHNKHDVVRPGEVVDFLLEYQVSDVSAFDDVTIQDLLPDGLEFVDESMSLTYSRNNVPTGPLSVTPVEAELGDGTSRLTLDVTAALSANGVVGGQLLGACVVDSFGGIDLDCLAEARPSTQGTVTYSARVLNTYRQPKPNSAHVLQNDSLPNTATISGEILNVSTGGGTENFDADDGSAAVSVATLTTEKSVAFINGEAVSGNAQTVSNGDDVTFRLTVNLGALAFHDLVVSDYLPLPVFAVPTTMSFEGSCAGELPEQGEVCFSPESTFETDLANFEGNTSPSSADYLASYPTVSTDTSSNSFHIDFGSLAVTAGQTPASTIDLFVTLPVADIALADGLFITNLLQAGDVNSENQQSFGQELAKLQYTRPQLNITNGIIEVSNSAFDGTALGLPVTVVHPLVSGSALGERNDPRYDRDVAGLDARDVVKVLVIVENTGRGKKGTYDLVLREQLPDGLQASDLVAGSMTVQRGDGATIDLPANAETDLFSASGIRWNGLGTAELEPVLERGILESGDVNNTGSNILYLTYEVILPDLSESARSFTTHSHVDHYAAEADGFNMTAPGLIVDDVTVSIIEPALTKSVIATSEAHTAETGVPQVAIGEVVRYRLAMTVPEGRTTGLLLSDELPNGLSFLPATDTSSGVRIAAVSQAAGQLQLLESGETTVWLTPQAHTSAPTGALTSSNSDAVPSARVEASGRNITVSLGDVVNDADNSEAELLIVEFNALVGNVNGNRGTEGVNSTYRLKSNQFTAEAGAADDRLSWTSTGAQVRIFEPRLRVTKTVSPTGDIDAGDSLTYTINVTNSGSDSVTAFDVELVDELPTHVVYVAHSTPTQVDVDGLTISHDSGTITVTASSIAPGGSIEFTIDATLASTVPSGSPITNTARLTASSLPGENGTEVNATGSATPGEPGDDDGERVYTPSGAVTFVSRTLEPHKSVVATSEAHTEDPYVAVGEVVRFRIASFIPEGVNDGLIFTDTLPEGLTFIEPSLEEPDIVRFAFVGQSLDVEPGLSDAVRTGVCPDLGTPTDLTASLPNDRIGGIGTSEITFDLGNVFNGTTNDSGSCVVVEFNARVDADDDAGPTAGAILPNSVFVTANEVDSDSATATVTVVEPDLYVTKTVNVGENPDAGDTVTYTIEIGHTAVSDAAAFDLDFTDTIPAGIADAAVASSTGAVTAVINSGVLTITADELIWGGTITVTITGVLAETVQPGTPVTNTVVGDWASLPEAGTAGGDNPTGSTSGPGRRYTPIDATATFTTRDLSLEKIVQATSEAHTEDDDVAIGEVVRYRLIVGVPEGDTPNLIVLDTLLDRLIAAPDAGVRAALVAEAGTDISAAALTGAQRYGTVSALPEVLHSTNSLLLGASVAVFSGNQVTIDLGNVNNSARNEAEEFIVLEFNAIVEAVDDNRAGTPLTNSALVRMAGEPGARASDDAVVTVREPSLELTKTVLRGSNEWSSTEDDDIGLVNADIGETVTFRLTLTNDADAAAAAYNVNLVDDLGIGNSGDPGFFQLTEVRVTRPGSAEVVIPSATDLSIALEVLEPNEVLIVEYDVLINDEAAFGELITNTASFTAQSVQDPGTYTGNPTGSPAGTPRTYVGNDTATVEMAEPTVGLSKRVSDGPIVRDEGIYDFTFSFVVRNVGATPLQGVLVTDDLSVTFPAGSGVTVTEATVTDVTVGGDTVSDAANSTFNQVVSGELDTNLLAPGSLNLDLGEEALITLEVQVQLSNEDALGAYYNTAVASGSTPGGIPSEPVESSDGDDPEGPPVRTTVTFTETASLVLTKQFLETELVSNQDGAFDVQYRLTIANTSTVPLRQLQISDGLSSVFDPGSVSDVNVTVESGAPDVIANPDYDGGVTDAELLGAGSMLAVGESATLLLSFTVAPVNSGVAYENTATATGSSPLGQTATDEATATATFEVEPEITIGTCETNMMGVSPRGTFTFDLVVSIRNEGDVQLDNTEATLNLATVFADAASFNLDETELRVGNDDDILNPSYGPGDWNLLAPGTTLYTSDQVAAGVGADNYLEIVLSFTVVPGNRLTYPVIANAVGTSPLHAEGSTGQVSDEATNWCDTSEPPSDSPTVIVFSDDPSLGVAKRFTGLEAVPGETGVFDISFEFVLKNYGDAQLNNVSLTDDFAAVFAEDGADWAITEITASAPLVAATLPLASGSTNLLDPASLLGSQGQTNSDGTVEVTLRVRPNNAGDEFENQAVASGENPEGRLSTDRSTDGDDPDPDGDGDPTNNDSPTPFTFESPLIGIAKSVPAEYDFGAGTAAPNPANLGDGQYQVAYLFTVVNYGDVALSDLTITDDLANQLAGANPVAFEAQDGTLDAAPSYDGQAASNILAPGQTLDFEENELITGTVYVVVTLEPGAALESGSLELINQAQVFGTSPGGQIVEDYSNAGTDPDVGQPDGDHSENDGDGDPTNNSGDTITTLTESPAVALAKQLDDVENLGDGDYTVSFTFTVANVGDVNLSQLQVTDDLNMAFRSVPVAITALSATAPLTANPDLTDALASGELLDAANSTLAVGESAAITLVATVTPGAELYEGAFENTAVASGNSPAGTEVTDRSNDGSEPVLGESSNTPISLTEAPLIGVAKGVPSEFDFGDGSVANPEANPRNLQDGTYEVAYLFTIGNYGDVVLTDLTLHDDLLTQLAAGNPVSVRAQDGSLTANPDWDGTAGSNLLATGQSLTASGTSGPTVGTVYAVVTLQPGEALQSGSLELTNQALSSGISPGQRTVSDDSNEGFDPDVGQPDGDTAYDGDGDPTNNAGDTTVTLTEEPLIAVAKRLVTSENLGDGSYSVTYAFLLENQGDVNLSGVQLTDPFLTTFRGSDVTITQLTADAPLAAATLADAQANWTLLDASASNLAVGESAGVEVTLIVVPGAEIHAGPFLNSATATGTSPSGAEVSDVSNDGATPDRNDHVPTPVTLTEEPVLGVAKAATVTPVGDGRFDVRFIFTITNYGDVELRNLQLTDDLDDAFGAGNHTVLSLYSPVLSVNGVAPDPSNPQAFDGSANLNLLAGTDTLAVGATATAELLVRVRPAHLGTHENQARGLATSPGERPVFDDSTDGLDPDPNEDGVPNEDTPTPVPFTEAPLIGLAKNATVVMNDDGSFNVVLTFTIRNMGDVPLRNVQVTDPLDGIYAITDLTPSHITVQSSDLTVNPNFDGASDPRVLGSGNTLAVGAERQVTVRLEGITPTSGTSTTNSAVASGESPNGTPTEDRSTDGFDPDPNGDGVPNEDTPTPIVFEVNPQIAIAKASALSVNEDGSFDVTFTLTVANTGNTTLHGVQVRDDLVEYYAGTDLAPERVSASSSRFTVSSSFDGQTDPRLLSGTNSLAVGASGTITVTLERITPNTSVTSFANTAVANGRGPDGTPTSDRSNDGLEPIPGVDVPTITDLIETPLLGVAKEATVVEELNGSFTVTFDFVLRNYGNVDLINLSLTDDLGEFYGDASLSAGNISVSSSDLPVNATYDGSTDTELLGAGAKLAVGESGRVTLVLSGLSGSDRTSYTNQADAGGETPGGTPTPPERSTDGTDPDPDGDGDPTNNSTPTPVELVASPMLGVAKLARELQNDDGSYRVEFELRLVNMGNAALLNLSLLDDLGEFYTHTDLSPAAVTLSSADLPTNPNFDGQSDLDLLGANANLPVGASGTVLITLDPLNPVSRTRFTNVATGAGETPSGVPVEDDSQNGEDPDPDGDGDPTNNSEPTPVVLEPQPSVGVAKRATVTANSDGSFDIRFDFVIGNYGNTRLDNLQLRDDLTTFYELTDLTPSALELTSSDFTINDGFDGQADPRLLAPGNSLGIGESGTLALTLVGVRVSGPVDTFNTAVGSATDPTGTPARPDLSQDGSDPDPDGDGDPSNNSDPTPVKLGQLPSVGLAKAASVTQRDDGGYDITFTLLARNYGDVPLASLSITDSLADFYSGTNLQPERVSVASDDLSVNAAYDGRSDLELLAPGNRLEVGATAILTIELSAVVPNAGVTRIDNLALVAGTAPDGTEVSDTSTDGSDPDPDGRGPWRHSEPTPVLFDSYVAVLLEKSVEPGPYGIGDRVPYTITIVNPNDVAVAFDLRDRLPEGTSYLPGTASFEDASLTPPEGSEPRQDEAGVIGWHSIVVPAGAQVSVSYQLRVQPGAKGPLVNRAEVDGASSNGAPVTATASASAELDEGVFDLDTNLLIGRVYLDVNRDGNYQEGVDVPLKDARVVLSNGWQTLTDEQGNYAFRDLDAGTWTVMVDRVSAPYRASDHPEQLRDERQHIVQVRGLTVSDFPFQLPDGLASSSRQTVVEFGPITLRKHLVQLPGSVRVVLEVTSDGEWPEITITDPVPGAEARTFTVTPGEPTTFTYDLPLGSPLTDPEINWSER